MRTAIQPKEYTGNDPMMVEEESGDSPGACYTVSYSGKERHSQRCTNLQPRVVVSQGLARRWSVDRPIHVQTIHYDCSLGGLDCAPTRYGVA